MKFIEVTGKTLAKIITDSEMHMDLESAGIDDNSIIRINQHGDIEVRRHASWDVVGGLLGEFDDRLREQSGLDWA